MTGVQTDTHTHTHTHSISLSEKLKGLFGASGLCYTPRVTDVQTILYCVLNAVGPLSLYRRRLCWEGLLQGSRAPLSQQQMGDEPLSLLRTSGQSVSTPPVKTTQKPDRHVTKAKMSLQTAGPKAAFHQRQACKHGTY